MKHLLIVLGFLLLRSCCSIAQIPTQFYLADSACTYYLPDYTQAVTVSDNCGVMQFVQTPTSGTKLEVGNDITVRLEAIDYGGNAISMQFDVILIDEMPPEFHISPELLIPTGMYQNENRTYHFYTYIDTIYRDEYGNFTKMYHYWEEEK